MQISGRKAGRVSLDREKQERRELQGELEAERTLVKVLGDNRQFLEGVGYPGAEKLDLWTLDITPRFLSKEDNVVRKPLPSVHAWKQVPSVSSGNPPEHWLGVDGQVYLKTTTWARGPRGNGQPHANWVAISPHGGYLYREMLQYALRLLRHYGAPHVPPVSRRVFAEQAVIDSLMPRPALPTQAQRRAMEAEAQCDDPRGALATDADPTRYSPDAALAGRHAQIRYLLLSWLKESTLTGPSQPALYGNVDGFLLPDAPHVSGGPALLAEVITLIGELVATGHAEWVDVLDPSRRFRAENQPVGADRFAPIVPEDFWTSIHFDTSYQLILTTTGLREADDRAAALVTSDYVHGLRKALLAWIGRNAKSQAVGLPAFCADITSHIGGVPATRADVARTARWLSSRGFIDISDTGTRITKRGLDCIDHFEGDPGAMGEAQGRGEDRRSFIASDGGIINVGSPVRNQIGKLRIETVDITGLVRFTKAVAEALPSLPIPDSEKPIAGAIATEILGEADKPGPDHPKLKALGNTLQAMVEGAANSAGSALAAGLLTLWHP